MFSSPLFSYALDYAFNGTALRWSSLGGAFLVMIAVCGAILLSLVEEKEEETKDDDADGSSDEEEEEGEEEGEGKIRRKEDEGGEGRPLVDKGDHKPKGRRGKGRLKRLRTYSH